MKSTCALVSLILLALAAPAIGESLPPFDAKKAKAIVERKRASTMELTWGAYKAVGKGNAKWDRLVERAMKENVEYLYGVEWDRLLALARFKELLAMAVEAGCDDPLVRFLHLKLPNEPTDDGAEHNRVFQEAVKAVAASKYPDFLKAGAWLAGIAEWQRKIRLEDSGLGKDTVSGFLDEALKVLANACRDRKPAQRDDLIELCQLVYKTGQRAGKGKNWFDRLDAEVFAKLDKNDALPHVVSGLFLVEHAWEARGTAVAALVRPEQFKEFAARLTEAEKRLTRAWELDKECAPAAAAMITVCMGRPGERDRDAMELWFRRALEADPLNKHAYITKLTYLLPKWHGRKDEAIEFGEEIIKSGQWDTGHPLFTLLVYRELAGGTQQAITVFRQQPTVWKAIEPILEEIRKRYPKSPLGASIYLYYAWLCDQNAAKASVYLRAAEDNGAGLAPGMFADKRETEQAMRWLTRGAGLFEEKE